MKFQCLNEKCKKPFLFPAKLIFDKRFGVDPGESIVEIHCCPYCYSIDIAEFVESQPEIASVKSVDLADVDAWIGKGYVVRELYAKTATLVKLEEEKP